MAAKAVDALFAAGVTSSKDDLAWLQAELKKREAAAIQHGRKREAIFRWHAAPTAAACEVGHLLFCGDLSSFFCTMLSFKDRACETSFVLYKSTRRHQQAACATIVQRLRRFKIVSPYAWQPSQIGLIRLRCIVPGRVRARDDHGRLDPWVFDKYNNWEECRGTIRLAEFEDIPDPPAPIIVVQNFFDLDDEPLELSRKSPTSTTTILVSPIQIHVLIGLDGDDLLDTVNLALGTNFLSVEHMWMLPRLEKYVPEYMTPIRSEVERYTELQWSE